MNDAANEEVSDAEDLGDFIDVRCLCVPYGRMLTLASTSPLCCSPVYQETYVPYHMRDSRTLKLFMRHILRRFLELQPQRC